MQMPCLARLDTLRGPMFLFDSSSVKAVLETLPIVTELAAGVPLQSSSDLMPDFAFAAGRFEGSLSKSGRAMPRRNRR
jgi:hypothetical protein